MSEQQDKRNKKIGLMTAMGIHLALAVIFFFILAWRQPNPPFPEYGIELNFGLDAAGTGDVQPETRPAPQRQSEPAREVEKTPPVEEQVEPAQEEVVEQAAESPAVQPEPSPVTEKPKTEKPVEKPVEKPKTEPKTESVEKPKEKPAETLRTAETNDTKAGSAPSHGDDQNAAGDKGDPEGTVDARALYGSQGGGGGAALNLAGWNWDYIPKPDESSNETGRIVFRIQVDERGEITNITTLERSVSPAVERIYRQAVERLTFSRTSAGPVPPLSTGTISFTIRAR